MRITQEQIDYCNSIDLLGLARQKGFNPKKVGTNSYKIEGFGGLYINPAKNCWNCFSENQGGGPIQFLMFIENTAWRRAVDELLDGHINVQTITIPKTVAQKESKAPFQLPPKNKTFKHIIAYLVQARKINKEVVYHFIENKQLYENDKHACVFVAYDEHKQPRFASYRSSSTKYAMRGDVKGSDKHYAFAKEGGSKELYIFESPIDLMSYLTLLYQKDDSNCLSNLNHHYISLDGLSQMGLDHYLETHPEIDSLVFCFDNDKTGNKAFATMKNYYLAEGYKTRRDLPEKKDYNEILVNGCKLQEIEQEQEDDELEYY